MRGQNLPGVGGEAWKRTLQRLINYRGFSSPTKLATSFQPPRLSYATIYRIMDLHRDVKPGTEEWDEKLAVLSGMLDLPVETLRLFYSGDSASLARLTFSRPGGEEIRQFILDAIDDPANPPRKRRASDRGR